MLSGMITIEGFLFYWVQRDSGGLAIYQAIEDAVDILPDAASALARGRYQAFIRAEMAMNPLAVDLFVVQRFFHPVTPPAKCY
jgi:hypothetical protein